MYTMLMLFSNICNYVAFGTSFFQMIFLCSGLEKALWLSALLMLIFARLTLNQLFIVIYVRFELHLFIDSDLW